MNKRTKIALYVLLALSACLFIWRFQSNYARLMKEGETKTDSDLINVPFGLLCGLKADISEVRDVPISRQKRFD